MDAERNKQNTRAAISAFNDGDLDRYLASYAPNAVIHGLPEHHEPNIAGHREYLLETRTALPDFATTIEHLVAEGDLVATHGLYSGTHQAVFHGVAPTGRRLTWQSMVFRRFNDDGLIVERWILGDNLALLHRLGQV